MELMKWIHYLDITKYQSGCYINIASNGRILFYVNMVISDI